MLTLPVFSFWKLQAVVKGRSIHFLNFAPFYVALQSKRKRCRLDAKEESGAHMECTLNSFFAATAWIHAMAAKDDRSPPRVCSIFFLFAVESPDTWQIDFCCLNGISSSSPTVPPPCFQMVWGFSSAGLERMWEAERKGKSCCMSAGPLAQSWMFIGHQRWCKHWWWWFSLFGLSNKV